MSTPHHSQYIPPQASVDRDLRHVLGLTDDHIARLRVLVQQLRGDTHLINYFCDVCKATVAPGQERFHCLDCSDYDMCASCIRQSGHTRGHRIKIYTVGVPDSGRPFIPTAHEDPLLSQVFGSGQPFASAPIDTGDYDSSALQQDKTRTDAFERLLGVSRTLLAWWELLSQQCAKEGQSPAPRPPKEYAASVQSDGQELSAFLTQLLLK